MLRFTIILLGLFWAMDTSWADPLDDAEGYVTRGAPKMMDASGLVFLAFDYICFALAVVFFGRALVQDKSWLQYLSRVIARPWSFGVHQQWHETRHRADTPLMVMMVVIWIFLCQFLSEMSLGVLAMIGLALLAVVMLKLIKA